MAWRHCWVATVAAATMCLAGCAAGPRETWAQVVAAHRSDDRAAAARLPMPVWQAASDASAWRDGYQHGDGARVRRNEGFDLAMRNPDWPRTHIAAVHIDVTSPDHWVRVVWAGPTDGPASDGPVGPWRSNPGRGVAWFDCDKVDESNRQDSHCTPKGVFRVKGFSDRLVLTPECWYATWVVDAPRFIAMHSHEEIPTLPASGGCVRMPYEAAKLIHNNSIVGVTLVRIDGKWTRPWPGRIKQINE